MRKLPLAPRFAVLLLFVLSGRGFAMPPGYTISAVHTALSNPTCLRFAPDGRLFYTELTTGRIMVYPTGTAPTASVWATVPVNVAGEQGLLSMEFHWDFPDSPYVFVDHTNPTPLVNRVVRLTESGGLGTSYTVFFDNLPAASNFHNGGRVAFGPDHMLYVTFGDQGDPSASQDPNDIRGKILRLGPGGKPAPGNPYGPTNPGVLCGVRNPFGICFDPQDGTGYFTENGPECDDELNLLTIGANYGWGPNDFCGGQPVGAYPALATFTPTIAPTGCCVYRGSAYPNYMKGNVFFGAFNTNSIYRAKFQNGSVTVIDTLEIFANVGAPVLDVTVGPDGTLWYSATDRIGHIVNSNSVSVDPGRPRVDLVASPNPFHETVTIAAHGNALSRIEVLDLSGRRVRDWTLDGDTQATWDGRDASGAPVPAGIYLIRASGPGVQAVRRVVRIGS